MPELEPKSDTDRPSTTTEMYICIHNNNHNTNDKYIVEVVERHDIFG